MEIHNEHGPEPLAQPHAGTATFSRPQFIQDAASSKLQLSAPTPQRRLSMPPHALSPKSPKWLRCSVQSKGHVPVLGASWLSEFQGSGGLLYL